MSAAETSRSGSTRRDALSRFLIGIDLGTTNTVMAYADREHGDGIRIFAIEQLVALGEVARRPQLPSMRYHPSPGELNPADVSLPWDGSDVAGMADAVVGGLAHELGSRVPEHLVTSAKSWLSHRSVDRTAAILPWGAGEGVPKVSPVAASASYLAHLRAAWNFSHPHHPLERQEVVLTIPASFDEGARALTVEAARGAGIPRLRLLEEPQAAFYDWLHRQGGELEQGLADTRLVLVCDVGGGTTDLTLIRVEPGAAGPNLLRIGVGDHLMLGGDNMDLGLAHLVERRMTADRARLGVSQLARLTRQCRSAKELLLAPSAPETVKVTLLGAGTSLIGGARSAELARGEVEEMVRDGFFPRITKEEMPRHPRGALVEFGLPYAADPAVSRHVAGFLDRHRRVAGEAPGVREAAAPDTVLLNGGVFRSRVLADRLLDTLGDWRGAPVRRLINDHPEWAVARGAVAYILARSGAAPRIGGGSARSYFLALEEATEQRRGVCLLPRGTEEGRELVLDQRSFMLRVGQPVSFRLLSSTADTSWQPGEIVDLASNGMVPLPPVATVLDTHSGDGAGEVQVRLAAQITEVGTLEVDCMGGGTAPMRWRLEFQLRGRAVTVKDSAALPSHFPEAARRLELLYGRHRRAVRPGQIKRLRTALEQLLGPREEWDGTLLRELFGVLWDGAGKRRRSADHERVWLNLAGYCLRPGYGHPLDDWRVERLMTLYEAGIQFVGEFRNWAEWWILWRRVAGGLDAAAQVRLFDDIAYYLRPTGRAKRPPGARKQGYDDMVRLAASLEHLPVERKIELGGWFLERLSKPRENLQTWWAVGRLGMREPAYGSAHRVVPPEVAAEWLERLLARDWRRTGPAAFAAAVIARMTGDRSRDIDADLRARVAERLVAIKAPAAWSTMIRETVALAAADERRILGDSLPAGLKLLH